jgi:hypothetical protein
MSQLDLSTTFSDAQTVTVDAISDYSVDQGAADKAIAHEVWVEFRVDTTFVGNGSSTLAFSIIGAAANASLTTSSTPIVSTPAIAEALLVAGYTIRLRVPITTTYRYLAVLYDVTNTFSLGKIDAYIIDTPAILS